MWDHKDWCTTLCLDPLPLEEDSCSSLWGISMQVTLSIFDQVITSAADVGSSVSVCRVDIRCLREYDVISIDQRILVMSWERGSLVVWEGKYLGARSRRGRVCISSERAVMKTLKLLFITTEFNENGCGPIAGNHWLNYVTPSLYYYKMVQVPSYMFIGLNHIWEMFATEIWSCSVTVIFFMSF